MKKYTAEQLKDGEKLAQLLASIPEEKRNITVMMTNSFMAGMEAQVLVRVLVLRRLVLK